MHFSASGPSRKLPIDLTRFDTGSGSWLLVVESMAETLAGRSLLVGMVLEQTIDDENIQTRRLELIVDSAVAREEENCAGLVDRIRAWVESSEGDGFLDLTAG